MAVSYAGEPLIRCEFGGLEIARRAEASAGGGSAEEEGAPMAEMEDAA
jgi:hypothetical protein